MANWELSVGTILGIITFALFYNAFNINEEKHGAMRVFCWLLGFLFIYIDLGLAIEIASANSAGNVVNLLTTIYFIGGLIYLVVFFYFMIFIVLFPFGKWLMDFVMDMKKRRDNDQNTESP